ncbi:tumor necrosis factor receptor superfamily member 9 isoform X1 [Equus przewalskii]|uniref:TNF receptor superfamily member 9 n=2 Tax=Equus TaxID=9789 RepID=A0A9L0TLI5_HORSE|nr:PREDICTED: tumor necrosis factor receptor superfamily member 9 isoform X1 [Equus przewalskii]XP_008534687.1 PREDICTED: tumor necrosis factor receptor superfamily member 9 isoform X1 [Equus przewalskii]XP_008534688.1 PREDICTED: tumor necrosis factor receptor superfamily member 9 isoform X1 [Equus przewalskii]XP_014593167.2 tumor necrosis factor receptor superfamily member 9 isoform X1 [Equus caballus]XP_014593168.2 tumor necrosis factor receptor superfamily member 9 isoform X1 [Equus caballus
MQDFIMGNGYYNIVATVLLVMNFERTRSIRQDSCDNCPAGTYCGKNNNQTCLPCPANSFSNRSGQEACDICKKCEGVFRTKKMCFPTSDAECECISGFHCFGEGCTMCEQDCKQGQELTKEGCKDCCFGTFNDQKSGVCRPWTNCSLDGKSVLVNGTKESDVVCGPTLADFSPGTSFIAMPAPARERGGHNPRIIILFLALTSTTALFLVFFLVLRLSVVKQSRKKLLYIFKQPFMRPAQTAQEEDACSCRFPEEEEGEGGL